MFYEAELHFLCDVLKKCHISTSILSPSAPLPEQLKALQIPEFFLDINQTVPFLRHMPDAKPAVLYRMTDSLNCQYLYCRLPNTTRDVLLVIGPFLTQERSKEQIMEWCEEHNIPPSLQKHLINHYVSIPPVPNTSYLYALLDTLGERLWGSAAFTVEDVYQDLVPPLVSQRIKELSSEEDTLLQMKNMEQRYAFENELITAVSNGQTHKVDMMLSPFPTLMLESRSSDPLRNLKNYCIIMNTLLRKAAEQGGVHPLHLDRTSSDFANRIEQLVSTQEIPAIMTEMYRTYCRLVNNQSTKSYSPTVQKAVTCIETDPAGNLNLRTLSQRLNVSSSYLSSLFKKDTGQTLTEYITLHRIRHAQHLLKTTRLQIQTVAQHCGFVDVHYFSKVFKRLTGVTPKEFRQKDRS